MKKNIEALLDGNFLPVISQETCDIVWGMQFAAQEKGELGLSEYADRIKSKFESEQRDILEYLSEQERASGLNVKWQHVYQQYYLVSNEFEKRGLGRIPFVSKKVIFRDVHIPIFGEGKTKPEEFDEKMSELTGFLKRENYHYFYEIIAFYNLTNVGTEDERAISANSEILLYFALNSQLKRQKKRKNL